ncbi:unnamed protein product [Closterium sp. Yama58-4]|nr:unnamed protein product [Closterium sp. Yama58-4]
MSPEVGLFRADDLSTVMAVRVYETLVPNDVRPFIGSASPPRWNTERIGPLPGVHCSVVIILRPGDLLMAADVESRTSFRHLDPKTPSRLHPSEAVAMLRECENLLKSRAPATAENPGSQGLKALKSVLVEYVQICIAERRAAPANHPSGPSTSPLDDEGIATKKAAHLVQAAQASHAATTRPADFGRTGTSGHSGGGDETDLVGGEERRAGSDEEEEEESGSESGAESDSKEKEEERPAEKAAHGDEVDTDAGGVADAQDRCGHVEAGAGRVLMSTGGAVANVASACIEGGDKYRMKVQAHGHPASTASYKSASADALAHLKRQEEENKKLRDENAGLRSEVVAERGRTEGLLATAAECLEAVKSLTERVAAAEQTAGTHVSKATATRTGVFTKVLDDRVALAQLASASINIVGGITHRIAPPPLPGPSPALPEEAIKAMRDDIVKAVTAVTQQALGTVGFTLLPNMLATMRRGRRGSSPSAGDLETAQRQRPEKRAGSGSAGDGDDAGHSKRSKGAGGNRAVGGDVPYRSRSGSPVLDMLKKKGATTRLLGPQSRGGGGGSAEGRTAAEEGLQAGGSSTHAAGRKGPEIPRPRASDVAPPPSDRGNADVNVEAVAVLPPHPTTDAGVSNVSGNVGAVGGHAGSVHPTTYPATGAGASNVGGGVEAVGGHASSVHPTTYPATGAGASNVGGGVEAVGVQADAVLLTTHTATRASANARLLPTGNVGGPPVDFQAPAIPVEMHQVDVGEDTISLGLDDDPVARELMEELVALQAPSQHPPIAVAAPTPRVVSQPVAGPSTVPTPHAGSHSITSPSPSAPCMEHPVAATAPPDTVPARSAHPPTGSSAAPTTGQHVADPTPSDPVAAMLLAVINARQVAAPSTHPLTTGPTAAPISLQPVAGATPSDSVSAMPAVAPSAAPTPVNLGEPVHHAAAEETPDEDVEIIQAAMEADEHATQRAALATSGNVDVEDRPAGVPASTQAGQTRASDRSGGDSVARHAVPSIPNLYPAGFIDVDQHFQTGQTASCFVHGPPLMKVLRSAVWFGVNWDPTKRKQQLTDIINRVSMCAVFGPVAASTARKTGEEGKRLAQAVAASSCAVWCFAETEAQVGDAAGEAKATAVLCGASTDFADLCHDVVMAVIETAVARQAALGEVPCNVTDELQGTALRKLYKNLEPKDDAEIIAWATIETLAFWGSYYAGGPLLRARGIEVPLDKKMDKDLENRGKKGLKGKHAV